MPATSTHRFYQYTLRPAIERDFMLAHDWTAADPWHGEIDPMFWLDQGPQSESYLLSDNAGPVFFFKMMRTTDPHIIELHVQFPSPAHMSRKNARVMLGLVIGLEWLESVLIPNNITTVLFESESPKLIDFCIQRLGFKKHGNRWLIKMINRGPGELGDVRTVSRSDDAARRADEVLSDGN